MTSGIKAEIMALGGDTGKKHEGKEEGLPQVHWPEKGDKTGIPNPLTNKTGELVTTDMEKDGINTEVNTLVYDNKLDFCKALDTVLYHILYVGDIRAQKGGLFSGKGLAGRWSKALCPGGGQG